MDPVERVRVRAREGDSDVEREDALAVEEPLEIRIRREAGGPVSSFVTTMRTPGADEELAAGLLFAEGVIAEPSTTPQGGAESKKGLVLRASIVVLI